MANNMIQAFISNKDVCEIIEKIIEHFSIIKTTKDRDMELCLPCVETEIIIDPETGFERLFIGIKISSPIECALKKLKKFDIDFWLKKMKKFNNKILIDLIP